MDTNIDDNYDAMHDLIDEYISVTNYDAFPVTDKMAIGLDSHDEAIILYADGYTFVKLCELRNLSFKMTEGVPSEYIAEIERFKEEYPLIRRFEVSKEMWIAIMKSYDKSAPF